MRRLPLLLLTACAARGPAPTSPPVEPSPVERLGEWLTGRFSSSAQAASDDAFYAVQLHVCPVSAPHVGAHVLYVEQALVERATAPYRQRLYVLEPLEPAPEGAPRVRSSVHTLTAPEAAVGLCDRSEVVTLSPDDHALRDGCHVDLTFTDGVFRGATPDRACASDLRGASFATSQVEVDASGIRSWDRGFDAEGQQVWGAEKGPYLFVRVQPQ